MQKNLFNVSCETSDEEWLGERGEKFPDIEALKQMRRHASLLYSKNDKDAKDEALSMLNDVMVQRQKLKFRKSSGQVLFAEMQDSCH